MISPWVSFETDTTSFETSAESDYFTASAVARAAQAYIAPGSTHDTYSEPAKSTPDWWTAVADEVVQSVMIWAGGGEVLLDGIRGFADKVGMAFDGARSEGSEKRVSRFRFVVTPKCAHEEMIIDELAFGRVKGVASREVEEWLSAVLK